MPKKLLVAAVTIIAVLLVAAVASGRVFELGSSLPQSAACPTNCQAINQVSGFQVQQGARRNPYRVNHDGKVVAFTVKLGKPTAAQIKFYNSHFGGSPQIRLTVLKPFKPKRGQKRQPNTYTLAGISPVFNLQNYFGSSPTFVLPQALTTKPGYVVGITVPTWAPAFAVNLGSDMQWRASRDSKNCNNVTQDAAQDTRGSLRTYGCVYSTARLLYSVTYVPDPQPTTTTTTPKTKTTK